jgi:outer membrane lipoprotein-sorting protein
VTVSRRSFSAGAAALLVRAGVGSTASAGDAGDVVGRVGRARADVRTMRGPFEQTRTVGLLATDVRSRGTLTLVRPDRLRWDLAPPDDVTFWVGPEGLAYRSAHGHGHVDAEHANVGGALDDLRALLGGELAALGARWDLRVTRDDARGAELEATPKPGVAARFERLSLSLASDLVRPVRAVLVEGPRDRTTIEFGAVVVNARVDDALMRPA